MEGGEHGEREDEDEAGASSTRSLMRQPTHHVREREVGDEEQPEEWQV